MSGDRTRKIRTLDEKNREEEKHPEEKLSSIIEKRLEEVKTQGDTDFSKKPACKPIFYWTD